MRSVIYVYIIVSYNFSSLLFKALETALKGEENIKKVLEPIPDNFNKPAPAELASPDARNEYTLNGIFYALSYPSSYSDFSSIFCRCIQFFLCFSYIMSQRIQSLLQK